MALIELVLMGELEELEENRRLMRQSRDTFFFRPPADMEFVANFRVTRELFEHICEEIVPLLPPKRNSRAIDPTIKILAALNFYAGSYQGAACRDLAIPMAQPTFSRCLREVSNALSCQLMTNKYMRFPQNRAERSTVKRGFYEKYRFPGVCGCIDCTHVAIVRPSVDEERFFNRKLYHSLNVQVICDVNCRILNVDASYGGATHDAFIWRNSDIRTHFEAYNTSGERALFLGDSGYPLREYMMIPVDNAALDTPEGHYNSVQKQARSTIERTFGMLKGRWRCLLNARKLHYKPNTAGNITIACCVLHNLCIQANMEPVHLNEVDLFLEESFQPPIIAPNTTENELRLGRLRRQEIINSFN